MVTEGKEIAGLNKHLLNFCVTNLHGVFFDEE